MTTNWASDGFLPPHEFRQKRPRDIIWAVAVSALFAAHIALILGQACPYWSICFPCTPIAPYFWPILAIGQAIWLITRAREERAIRPRRTARVVLALILIAFATDTLTGGDYRWFEIAMRREMRKCGGPAPLQGWAQGILTSPQQIAALEDHEIDIKDLPSGIKSFAAEACEFPHTPQYRRLSSGGPWFMFNQGGWDMGWGVIVGKSDLVDPSPINLPYGQHRGWTKELQPGVYLYAF
jgi:hypothetical protein